MTSNTGNQNRFVEFLTMYGRSAENEAAYDESLYKAAKELGVEPPQFVHPQLFQIVQRLSDANPPSVVLTGNAGDGKTHLCRCVVQELAPSQFASLLWDDISFPSIDLPHGKKLTIIKDFTARGENDRKLIMARLAKSVFHADHSDEVFLIAANEGIVAHKSATYAQDLAHHYEGVPRETLVEMAETLEEMLNLGIAEKPDRHFLLYDLSQQSAAEMLKCILPAILDNPQWPVCSSAARTCPLHENKRRLSEDLVQQRLLELVEMLDLNGEHLTVRNLFALVVNALTGHRRAPTSSPMITHCCEYRKTKYADAPAYEGAYFENIFGGNLPRTEKTKPFSNLLRTGIGQETNNRIDQLLVFGDLEDNTSRFDELIPVTDIFAEKLEYVRKLSKYREGCPTADSSHNDEFLDHLQAHRRRLYFELGQPLADEFCHRQLTVFHSAPIFRDEIICPLRAGKEVREAVVSKLLLGLNRVFVGAMIDDDTRLYLTTSGTTTQERISSILIQSITQDDPDYDGVRIERRMGHAIGGFAADLIVKYKGNEIGKFLLTLARFDYINRVAEGVLPSSFSVQQYEDILVFKSQLILKLSEFAKPQAKIQTFTITHGGDLKGQTVGIRI